MGESLHDHTSRRIGMLPEVFRDTEGRFQPIVSTERREPLKQQDHVNRTKQTMRARPYVNCR